jgi:PKD repeat protein
MFKKIIILIFTLNLTVFHSINAQKEDHIWQAGYFYDRNIADTTYGSCKFDFKIEPVRIYSDTLPRINMSGGNSSISDASGRLLASSNGQVIMNAANEFIEDTINYSTDLAHPWCNEWDGNTEIDSLGVITTGMLGLQRVIILPIDNKYFVIYTAFDECEFKTFKVAYSEFIIDETYLTGKIISKDKTILNDDLAYSIHAVRHGNGRDWWIVVFTLGHEWMYSILLSENGVSQINKVKTGLVKRPESAGQICFSPDGNKLAFFVGYNFTPTGAGFGLVDFNRCDGTITNLKSKILSGEYGIGAGVAFSNDGRYLYVANTNFIMQYDTKSNDMIKSEKIVAEYDGFKYKFPEFPNFPVEYSVNFCLLKTGPDGRMYIFPTSAMQRYMSVMDYPYESFDKVNVRQHSIFMPKAFQRTVPNIPEFRTGPLDGSPCDTLGLDNDPVAKFRYEADTLDHLLIKFTDLSYFRPELWRWDFGDGSPVVEQRYPTHRFPKNGTYKVCLLVNNENSANTVCRYINIGTSSTDTNPEKPEIDITLYPNPVEDMLQITLGEYIPENGKIKIMDISGKTLLSQRLYYGQNVVDLSQLQAGLYFCDAMDGIRTLKVMKVVKE